jgi:hypothetical protein
MKNVTWINFVLGAWLLIAPSVLSTVVANPVWTANDIVLGILLLAVSAVIVSAASPSRSLAWFEVLSDLRLAPAWRAVLFQAWWRCFCRNQPVRNFSQSST